MSTGAELSFGGLTGGWEMAPSRNSWVKTSVSCHVDLSIECPDDLATSFPQDKWSERKQGRSYGAFCDVASEVTYHPYSIGHPWHSMGGKFTRPWIPGAGDHWDPSWRPALLRVITTESQTFGSWLQIPERTVFWKRETFCVASKDRVKLIIREFSGRHKSTWFEAEPHCNKLTQVEGVALEGSDVYKKSQTQLDAPLRDAIWRDGLWASHKFRYEHLHLCNISFLD